MTLSTATFGWDSFFSTTTTSAITSTSTTIPLASAPTATEGVLVLEPNSSTNREIIYYTGVSGNSVTLPSVGAGRGQEGTTAVAHSSGVTVKRNTTSRDFEVLQDGGAISAGAITPVKLASGAATTWAWQSWTPTYTNLSGGTTTYAKYVQVGKNVFFRLKYALASTDVSGLVGFTVPVSASSDYATSGADTIACTVEFTDTGSGFYMGAAAWGASNRIDLFAVNAGGTYASYSSTSSSVPFTWGATDVIYVAGVYEAA